MSEPSSSINSYEGKASEVIEEFSPLEIGRKTVNNTSNENDDSLNTPARHIGSPESSSDLKQNSQRTHSKVEFSTKFPHDSQSKNISIPVPLTTPTPEDLNSIAKDPFTDEDVLKQVEFYFSNNNLPKDKFLFRTIQANPEGWVAISTLAVFNRMKKFRPISRVINALKSSNVLEVSMDDQMVKRRTPILPMDDKEKDEVFRRTVYAKGFGIETENLQLEVEQWFSQFGSFKEVRLRRDDNKIFKNSAFVEFVEQQDAQKFVQLSPKPKFKGNEIMALIKPDYIEMLEHHKKFGGSKGIRSGRGALRGSSDDSRCFGVSRRSSRSDKGASKTSRGSLNAFCRGAREFCGIEDTSGAHGEIGHRAHESTDPLFSNEAELTRNRDFEGSENKQLNDSFSCQNSPSRTVTYPKLSSKSKIDSNENDDEFKKTSREKKLLKVPGRSFRRSMSRSSGLRLGSSTKARGFDPREREPRELRDRTFDPRDRQPREPRDEAFDRAPRYMLESFLGDRGPRYYPSSFPGPPNFERPLATPTDYRIESDHPPLRGGYGPPTPIPFVDYNLGGYGPPQAEYSQRIDYPGLGPTYTEISNYGRGFGQYPGYGRYYPLVPEYSRSYTLPPGLVRNNLHTGYDRRPPLGFSGDFFPPAYDSHTQYNFNSGLITSDPSNARTLPNVPLGNFAGSANSHGRHETDENSPRGYSHSGYLRAREFESPRINNNGSSDHATPQVSGPFRPPEEAYKSVDRTPGPMEKMPTPASRFHLPDERLLPPEYSQILDPAQRPRGAQSRSYQSPDYSETQDAFRGMQGSQNGYGRSPSGYNDYY